MPIKKLRGDFYLHPLLVTLSCNLLAKQSSQHYALDRLKRKLAIYPRFIFSSHLTN